jgi:hypothetical protein
MTFSWWFQVIKPRTRPPDATQAAFRGSSPTNPSTELPDQVGLSNVPCSAISLLIVMAAD